MRDRFAQGIIRRVSWVDTRDMLADGLTKDDIDRTLLHNVSNACSFKLAHEALTHPKFVVGSSAIPAETGIASRQ